MNARLRLLTRVPRRRLFCQAVCLIIACGGILFSIRQSILQSERRDALAYFRAADPTAQVQIDAIASHWSLSIHEPYEREVLFHTSEATVQKFLAHYDGYDSKMTRNRVALRYLSHTALERAGGGRYRTLAHDSVPMALADGYSGQELYWDAKNQSGYLYWWEGSPD